jgi:polyphosphate glucokinase
LQAPVRLLNDAEIQGFGIVRGRGLELVLTLGTGAGTALFRNGELMPHLELAQHPLRAGKTYNDYIGDAVLQKKGAERWSRHVRRAIKTLYALLHYDVLYLGGGNAAKVLGLPPAVEVASNDAGITGGVMLWQGLAAPDLFGPAGGKDAA